MINRLQEPTTPLSSAKRAIADLVRDSALYEPLRSTYYFLWNREGRTKRNNRVAFFSQFVRSGSLVLDIGANIAEFTRTFVELGATVVAVEPLPECVAYIRTVRPRDRVHIEAVAVGERAGTATMLMCGRSMLASVSPDWVAIASSQPRFADIQWRPSISVPVVTLDFLVAKYGQPQLIKIDVEGYEPQVLTGLSQMPRVLTFEFNAEWLASTVECVRKPCFSGDVEFNWIWGEPSLPMESARWLSRNELLAVLQTPAFAARKGYGDIIVRRRAD